MLRLDIRLGRRLPALVLELRIRLGWPAAPGPLDVHRRVYGDPSKPAPDAPATERGDIAIRAQECLLDRVGRLISIGNQPVHEREQVVLVALDKLVEGRELAADSLTDQGDVDPLARVLDPGNLRLPRVGHGLPVRHVRSTAPSPRGILSGRGGARIARVRRSPPDAGRQAVPCRLAVPTWRNWHTRSTQNRVAVRSCGFNSRRRHHAPP